MNKSFARWLYNQISSTTNRRPRRRQFAVSYRLAEIQILDERVLLSGPALTAVPATDLNESGTAGPDVIPMVVPNGYSGYTPAQVRHAYGFDQISFNGTAGDGTGTTIAIVDAYDDPNITSDLHQFDLAFELPDPPTFTKLNQSGSTSNLPGVHAGWALEIALDVEWAHAIAPGANIVLVEANTTNFSDFFAAVNTARNYAGVNVVSMSWGGR